MNVVKSLCQAPGGLLALWIGYGESFDHIKRLLQVAVELVEHANAFKWRIVLHVNPKIGRRTWRQPLLAQLFSTGDLSTDSSHKEFRVFSNSPYLRRGLKNCQGIQDPLFLVGFVEAHGKDFRDVKKILMCVCV